MASRADRSAVRAGTTKSQPTSGRPRPRRRDGRSVEGTASTKAGAVQWSDSAGEARADGSVGYVEVFRMGGVGTLHPRETSTSIRLSTR
jgi:hypothetical protein